MRVLITGATGGVGGTIVEQLLAAGVTVRASSRAPAQARLPAHVEVVAADLDAPASLTPALDGVDAVFLYAAGRAPRELAQAIRRAGVGKAVVLSTIDAGSDRPYAQYNKRRHLEVEEAMAEAGLRVVALRPGAFARNALRFWARSIAEEGLVRLPFPAAEQAPVDERDLTAVAVRALVSRELDGQAIVITGPQSLSQRDQVGIIGAALGRPLGVVAVDEPEARAALARIVPPAYVELLMAQWRDEVGVPAVVTDAVARITGRAPATYAEWAARNVARFGARP